MSVATPEISVLVPTYNTEKYLAQALDSLVAQTFANFEVICINDGSTDSSPAIMGRYVRNDERFRIIDKANSGYGASMNLGISEARGTYIAILEPDDIYEPNTLAALYAAAHDNDAQVAKGNYWFYWSQPEERNQLISVIKPELAGCVINPQEETSIYFAIPSIWSGLYRRDFLLENNIKFLETPGASFQDLGFTFKVWAYATRAALIDDPLLHYRQDNEQSSVNNPDKAFCVCTELEEIERVAATRPNANQLKAVVYRMKYDNYLWNYQRLTPELREQFLPRMVEDLKVGYKQGDYCANLFGSWQQKSLELLVGNPEKFKRIFPDNPTKAARAVYYLRLGGPRAIADILKR